MANTWLETVSKVESMIPLLGKLGREQSVKVQLAGQTLMSDSVTGLVALFDQYPAVDLARVYQVLEQLIANQTSNAVVELEEALADADIASLEGFAEAGSATPVVLYGFGRIGS